MIPFTLSTFCSFSGVVHVMTVTTECSSSLCSAADLWGIQRKFRGQVNLLNPSDLCLAMIKKENWWGQYQPGLFPELTLVELRYSCTMNLLSTLTCCCNSKLAPMKYCCAITRKILIHVIKVENCWKNCKARVSFGNACLRSFTLHNQERESRQHKDRTCAYVDETVESCHMLFLNSANELKELKQNSFRCPILCLINVWPFLWVQSPECQKVSSKWWVGSRR